MISNEVEFPIIELTDWVFDGEKVIEAEFKWVGIHHIKEKDFEKQHKRILVDCNGEILKVTGNKIIRKTGSLLSFLIPPTLTVEFNLEKTGNKISLDDLKSKIISKSSENFNITHSNLISLKDYNSKIINAKTYRELIYIAAFVDEE